MASREQNSLFHPPLARLRIRDPFTVLPPSTPRKRRRRDGDEASSSSRSGEDGDGDEDDEPVAPGSKPAQDWRRPGRSLPPQRIRSELAALKPPLHLPRMHGERGRITGTPLTHHVTVLMAILHRCLRARDFVRAGRAWGLLLRTPLYPALDLRYRGLYGIGAEILLHRGSEPTLQEANEALQHGTVHQRSTTEGLTLDVSREGFEAAKAFYERLAIEYRYLHRAPNLLSGLDFYPIMYGLWIAFVQDNYLKARHAALRAASRPPGDHDRESMDVDATNAGTEADIAEARATLAQEVDKILDSMAELMIVLPYSDSADLKELRSQLGQWKRHLQGQAATDHSPNSIGSQDSPSEN